MDSSINSTTQAKTGSLRYELAAALPASFHCKVRYVHTPPKRCDPLFSPPPGHEAEQTRLASHFLTVSIDTQRASNPGKSSSTIVLGVEVLVYSTRHLTTIFVSKADSTGYLPQQRPSPIKTVCTTFLKWLSSKEREKHLARTIVVSLFARAQSQYLFPGSAENAGKHVLDDRQLIKWWLRVLDPIFPPKNEGDELSIAQYNGYVTVPGYEGTEVRSFLPSGNSTSQHWKPGNPLSELGEKRGVTAGAPPRCVLPRFPDDPKARFMQDLDDEVGISDGVTHSPSKKKQGGKWNNIRDLNRFWEAMEFRQECSSGRVVGFVWLVMRPSESEKAIAAAASKQASSEGAQSNSQDSLASAVPSSSQESRQSTSSRRRRQPLTGPIVPRQPRLKGGSSSSSHTAGSELNGTLNTETPDGVVLSKDAYDNCMHTMLHLDFATPEVATRSTEKWVAEVGSACGIQPDRWTLDVVGEAKVEKTGNGVASNGTPQVNDLGGMIKKKKRKTEGNGDGESEVEIDGSGKGVNVLSSGMIRKKPKVNAA